MRTQLKSLGLQLPRPTTRLLTTYVFLAEFSMPTKPEL